jgi:hypothetical protein
MLGKISVGVLIAANGPRIRMTIARTMNVYGRESAIRTSHVTTARSCALCAIHWLHKKLQSI